MTCGLSKDHLIGRAKAVRTARQGRTRDSFTASHQWADIQPVPGKQGLSRLTVSWEPVKGKKCKR